MEDGDTMLVGRSVRLRAMEPGDAERAHAWMNDPEVTYYLTARYPSASAAENWLAGGPANSFAEGVRLAIETKDGVHIGGINLHQVQPEDRTAGLGIIVGERTYWSNGYGTDAVVTLLRFAFHEMNLHRVWLTVLESHKRGIACYGRCGFREEARLRQDVYRHDQSWDVILMGVLRDEFEALHGAPQ